MKKNHYQSPVIRSMKTFARRQVLLTCDNSEPPYLTLQGLLYTPTCGCSVKSFSTCISASGCGHIGTLAIGKGGGCYSGPS